MASDRREFRRRTGVFVAVSVAGLLLVACSDDDSGEALDVGAAMFDDDGVGALYDDLVEGAGTSPDHAGHAASAGASIAAAVNLANEVLPDDPDAFTTQTGSSPTRYFRNVGSYLATIAGALDDLDPGDGDSSVAFALELGWTMGHGIEPTAESVDRLTWVLPSDVVADAEVRGEVARALEASDYTTAARIVEQDLQVDGAEVVVALDRELSGHVPVTPELDLLTELHTGWQLAR